MNQPALAGRSPGAASGRWRRVATQRIALTAAALLGAAAVPADAAFSGTASVAQATVATATLAPATGLAASCAAVLGVGQVTLTWTATASTFATGYQLWRRQGAGAWIQRATITPRTTATYQDPLGTLSTLLGATFTYRLVAVRGSWTATATTEPTVSVSALGLC